ncbi:MAG: hypothetical protein AB8F74_14295 [Saprospiraceae bacterium]
MDTANIAPIPTIAEVFKNILLKRLLTSLGTCMVSQFLPVNFRLQ